jgi:NADH dehydrogenase [ubiquinone] 1 alpha subcomplex assembly factor 1
VPIPITLFSFDHAAEAAWSVVNDGVMGGRSAGFVSVANGVLRFSGTLVTQGGGFTLVRAPRAVDLTGYDAVELRVRGSGRRFQLEVSDGTQAYSRRVSRRAGFETSAEWAVVRVPFAALGSTIMGRVVEAPPIDLARVESIGLYMADKQDGAFWIEVDYLRAVTTAS